MLSILIPIYNYNVSDLVKNLHSQAKELNIDYEILLVDDFSIKFKEQNQQLSKLENVEYEELTENYGRSKIRNYLAQKAKYENLLFLDCDGKIIRKNFLKKYLDNTDVDVICGGRNYQKNKPEKKYRLHWFYGIERETIPPKQQQEQPYNNFKTHNFLIKKHIFTDIKFDENITTYGHEDTLFGYELQKKNIPIKHIDNPVEHIGLEENRIFLQKTLTSVENLYKLYLNYQAEKDLFKNIKLMKYFFYLKKFYFCYPFGIIFVLFKKLLIKRLLKENPPLKYLDILKLAYICKLAKDKKKFK